MNNFLDLGLWGLVFRKILWQDSGSSNFRVDKHRGGGYQKNLFGTAGFDTPREVTSKMETCFVFRGCISPEMFQMQWTNLGGCHYDLASFTILGSD